MWGLSDFKPGESVPGRKDGAIYVTGLTMFWKKKVNTI